MSLKRYLRQIPYLGKKNQEKLKKAKIVIVGCGGLGTFASSMLVRMGLGYLTIIDKDKIEFSNLHRGCLFDEKDLGKFKAEVTKKKLKKINSNCKIQIFKTSLKRENLNLLKESELILDCTDNIETRYLINEFAIRNKIPWIYSAILGDEGMVSPFKGKPCLKCLIPNATREKLKTTKEIGIFPPIVNIIASFSVSEALKILLGNPEFGKLFYFNLKEPKFEVLKIKSTKNCPICSE